MIKSTVSSNRIHYPINCGDLNGCHLEERKINV